MSEFKIGDWVVYELYIGQVKSTSATGKWDAFSNGVCETSGRNLLGRMRPLTLRNKAIVETFHDYYRDLNKIDGNAAFNWPDIHNYFSELALAAIDYPKNTEFFDKATNFIKNAKRHVSEIDRIKLFRSAT